MSEEAGAAGGQDAKRSLAEAAGGYAAFCALSFASRLLPALLLLVVIFGLAFPRVWDRLTSQHSGPGFTRRNLGRSLLWGSASGAGFGLYTWAPGRGWDGINPNHPYSPFSWPSPFRGGCSS